MKIKSIKSLISNIYHRGVYDGMDIVKGSTDRFYGNAVARERWEEKHLKDWFTQFKKLLQEDE